ncbi:hypothetical protein [Nocardia heshunensis]
MRIPRHDKSFPTSFPRSRRGKRLKAPEDVLAQEIQRIEVQERRWQMRKSLLDREPAAVLIGGLLLFTLSVGLMIAMFTHTCLRGC